MSVTRYDVWSVLTLGQYPVRAHGSSEMDRHPVDSWPYSAAAGYGREVTPAP